MDENKHLPDIVSKDRRERFAELIAIAASAAPWIGGPISAIIGGVATDLKIKRVTQFVKDVLEHIESMHSQESEKFVRTEDFADIFDKTAQAVADERYEAKRKLFANYILSNVAAPNISYQLRLKCLKLLEDISTEHIDLLLALLQKPNAAEMGIGISAPSTTIERRAPHLRTNLRAIIHETNILGLTDIKEQYLNTTMTAGGAANLSHSVTSLGMKLIEFITWGN